MLSSLPARSRETRYAGDMKTVAVLVAGVALGVILTFGAVDLSGGWYTYHTLPTDECHGWPPSGIEVVPNQPNPCHFRRPRWHVLY
jgi:hypothetical protein